jgi:hypothetical protein
MQRVRPVSDYIADLRRWTTEVLSRPSEELRGMPPCPFAADAWDAGRVAVGLCDGLSATDLSRYVEDKNEGLVAEDMWLMAYHPDDDPNEYGLTYLDAEWEPVVPEDYAMIFVQQLSKLTAASYNLEKQGYYDECPWKTYRDLVHRRTEKAIQHGKFRPDDI